ncbi:MAG: type II secretion system F family protein, partial [Desulfobacterales bacterium]|nr:type II secretion system F family protein [Desulfobacterales bacterium]
MPHFNWKGKNSYGEKRKGVIEAPNIESARGHLKKIRITPTKLKEKPKDIFENVAFFQPKVTGKDVVVFTRQLSTLIEAGLPMVQGQEKLRNHHENPTFKKIQQNV